MSRFDRSKVCDSTNGQAVGGCCVILSLKLHTPSQLEVVCRDSLILTTMSSNLWRDSDPSDDDGANQAATRKRSSRGGSPCFYSLLQTPDWNLIACDQCRKTKSKCERLPADSDICKNCAASGNGACYNLHAYQLRLIDRNVAIQSVPI